MRDVIVYCRDTAALVAELREQLPERLSEEDEGNPVFILDKTPTVRNGDETLSLVRCRDGDPGEPDTEVQLNSLESVTVLGTWEEVKADPTKKAIYDRVYPRTPIVWTDDDSVEHTTIPPEEIGRFA